MAFTDKNILSVYTERITMEKIIKTKQKKRWHVIYTNKIIDGIYFVDKIIGKLWTLFIISITKGITNEKFHRYFPKSSRTVHFSIALLIIVLYIKNHRRIEKSSVFFGGFLKNFD
jgi:hypothetical protein